MSRLLRPLLPQQKQGGRSILEATQYKKEPMKTMIRNSCLMQGESDLRMP